MLGTATVFEKPVTFRAGTLLFRAFLATGVADLRALVGGLTVSPYNI